MQLIVKNNKMSPISESYRTLRTNIKFTDLDNENKVILVTSSGKGEGKTTTISNLAYSVSETGKKVLLIDCDMRRPSIHRIFRQSNLKGISNYLIGEVSYDEAINKVAPNLYILTSGTIPPNPSELLDSMKMKKFIKQLSKDYDYIFIDAPPVLAVTDAQILSTLCSGVIFVVASGKTEKQHAKQAIELLEKVNAKILGAVLTQVEQSDMEYSYHYYYGEDDKKNKQNRRKNLFNLR